jgi:hypothetical protein
MTISNPTLSAGPFTSTGASITCPFAIRVWEAGDIKVTSTSPAGVVTTLAYGSASTGYTIAFNADQVTNPGGSITTAAVPSGHTIRIAAAYLLKQSVSLTEGGPFFAKSIEYALDRVTAIAALASSKAFAAIPSGGLKTINGQSLEGTGNLDPADSVARASAAEAQSTATTANTLANSMYGQLFGPSANYTCPDPAARSAAAAAQSTATDARDRAINAQDTANAANAAAGTKATPADITAALAAHNAAADPHPGYQTQAESDARYVRTVNGVAPDAAGNVNAAGGSGSALLTQVAPATAIPLDGNKVFNADTISSTTALTIAAGQVEGGSCTLAIRGNGSAWGGITGALKASGSASFVTTLDAINHVLVWVERGRVRYTVSQSDPLEYAITAAPSIVTAPALSLSSGSASTVGAVYAVSNGTWTGSPSSYTYLWSRSPTGAAGSWTTISGATAATYTLTASDAGQYVRATVQATNVIGSSAANAATDLGPILSAPAPLTSIFTATGVTQGAAGAYTITASGLKGSSSVSASGDFELTIDFTGNTTGIAAGVATSNTAGSWTGGFKFAVMDDAGSSRWQTIIDGVQGSSGASWVADASLRRARVKRVGTTVTMQVSNDGGTTWVDAGFVPSYTDTTGVRYPVIGSFTAGGSLKLTGQGFA